MNYDPRFFNVHYIVDPEYDEICEIDFVGRGDGVIDLTGDDKLFSLSIDELYTGIQRQKMKYTLDIQPKHDYN